MSSMLFTIAMNATPIRAPAIEPLPPARLAPPRITAVIAFNSAPAPAVETAVPTRAAKAIPARPAIRPIKVKARTCICPTAIPDEERRFAIAADVIILAERPGVPQGVAHRARQGQHEPGRRLDPQPLGLAESARTRGAAP